MDSSTIGSEESNEAVYLVAFRMDAANAEPELYSLLLMEEEARGDQDRPLTSSGRIVFFTDVHQAQQALRLGDEAFAKHAPAPTDVAIVYEVGRAIQSIRVQSHDPSAHIVDLLNVVFDFVTASRQPMPPEYQDALSRFADHLTFSRDYGDFFTRHTPRSLVVDALLWCVGAVASQATVLTPTPFSAAQSP